MTGEQASAVSPEGTTATPPGHTPSPLSKSLAGQKRRKLYHSADESTTAEDVVARQEQRHRPAAGSGGSGDSDQSATKWFDQANQNVLPTPGEGEQNDGGSGRGLPTTLSLDGLTVSR